MHPVIKKFINEKLETEVGILLLFLKGKIYWLYQHYKHLHPEQAPRVLLGKGSPPPNALDCRDIVGGKKMYIHQKLKI